METINNDLILEKAKQILSDRKRTETIVSAGLCPTCGEELVHYNKVGEYDFITITGYKCNKDKSHYNNFTEYYDDDDEC